MSVYIYILPAPNTYDTVGYAALSQGEEEVRKLNYYAFLTVG